MMVFTKLILNRLSQEYWEDAADCRSLAKSFNMGWEVFKDKIESHFPVYLEKFGGLDAVAVGIKEAGHSHKFVSETFNINPRRVTAFSRLVRELRPDIGRATWKSKNNKYSNSHKDINLKHNSKSYRCGNCGGVYISVDPGICRICNYDNLKVREA